MRSFQTLTLDDNLFDFDFIRSIIIHFEIFILPGTGFQIDAYAFIGGERLPISINLKSFLYVASCFI